MITKQNRVIKEYLKEVRSHLPCTSAQKREIIDNLECSIWDFLDYHPDADITELKKHFGSPEKIAEEYGPVIDEIEFHKIVKKKKRFWYLLATSALVLFLIGAALFVAIYFQQSNDIPRYYIVEKDISDLSSVDNIWNDTKTVTE